MGTTLFLAAEDIAQRIDNINQRINGVEPYRKSSAPVSPPSPGTFTEDKRTPYLSTSRSVLAFKDDPSRALIFQFNPRDDESTKTSTFVEQAYPSLPFSDQVWSGGGANTRSFSLFLDATTDSHNPHFGKGEYGKEGLNQLPARGLYPEIELLKSFQEPRVDDGSPRFTSGGLVPNKKFLLPPVAVFIYGEEYLECRVTSLSITVNLRDAKAIPRRASAQITLTILERIPVKINSSLKALTGL